MLFISESNQCKCNISQYHMNIVKHYLWNSTQQQIPTSWTKNLGAKEVNILIIFCREGGDTGLFIILVPKFYNNVFLFLGLTTMGTFIEF